MTKDEAIKRLKELRSGNWWAFEDPNEIDITNEALDMAIEALSEPTVIRSKTLMPNGVVYGFDWQEERNIGSNGWCMRECAKTITSTKPGATMVSNLGEIRSNKVVDK